MKAPPIGAAADSSSFFKGLSYNSVYFLKSLLFSSGWEIFYSFWGSSWGYSADRFISSCIINASKSSSSFFLLGTPTDFDTATPPLNGLGASASRMLSVRINFILSWLRFSVSWVTFSMTLSKDFSILMHLALTSSDLCFWVSRSL